VGFCVPPLDGTTGVLLSEPGQFAAEAPRNDRSGRKAPWITEP
jgi:hypothetical protein